MWKAKTSLPLSRNRAPAYRQAVDYILQVARGLAIRSQTGIVHRDIKPANLLLDKEGTVKILDMGLARVVGLADEADEDRLTAAGK